MLTSHQIRCLQTTERCLREIQSSEEFRQLKYYPDVTLGDAIQAVSDLLDEHQIGNYKSNTVRLSSKPGRLRVVTQVY